MTFQEPSTKIMEGLIDLHHDIMFFLIVVAIFVLWLLLRIVHHFRVENIYTIRSDFTHHKTLETI
jgi:cytochrome c oxidase subunit 2